MHGLNSCHADSLAMPESDKGHRLLPEWSGRARER